MAGKIVGTGASCPESSTGRAAPSGPERGALLKRLGKPAGYRKIHGGWRKLGGRRKSNAGNGLPFIPKPPKFSDLCVEIGDFIRNNGRNSNFHIEIKLLSVGIGRKFPSST